MRLLSVVLLRYRSISRLEFEAGPFTVLFGKNNAGKSNILECIYAALIPQGAREVRGDEGGIDLTEGALFVELDPEVRFDKCAAEAVTEPGCDHPRRLSFVGLPDRVGVCLGDPGECVVTEFPEELAGMPWDELHFDILREGPDLHLLMLDWEFARLSWIVAEAFPAITDARAAALPETTGVRNRTWGYGWLERIRDADGASYYRVHPSTIRLADQLSTLATDLLPDFIDGSIDVQIVDPAYWTDRSSRISLHYLRLGEDRGTNSPSDLGHGPARWIAAAVQIALHLMAEYPDLMTLRDAPAKGLSGHVLLADEPEAHLHASAVASIVRWCHRMVAHGFTVIGASHHEEFLRSAGDDLTLVHVTRDSPYDDTAARTLPSARSTRLLELAVDVGMHPASALSIRRAILFVEGPLDEAVLDEYAGIELDAAGVKIVPIHGTKNLEGIVAFELVADLGVRLGILTDATDAATMATRSGRKRSSEERKVLRVLNLAEEKGIPLPAAFGVPEDDLLFALPSDAIRDYLNGPFPGWKELVAECRHELGKGPSDSVDWKSFALERYGLPISTPTGVRDIVRALDLKRVSLPSIRVVIDQIVDWAKQPDAPT